MNDFENIKLPKSSSNEELEILSNDKLKPIFNQNGFIVRDEIYKDKGIDYIIELKEKDYYLNFRFNVQLKATDSIKKNVNGTYSLSIDTSNINYLLNNVQKSIY